MFLRIVQVVIVGIPVLPIAGRILVAMRGIRVNIQLILQVVCCLPTKWIL